MDSKANMPSGMNNANSSPKNNIGCTQDKKLSSVNMLLPHFTTFRVVIDGCFLGFFLALSGN